MKYYPLGLKVKFHHKQHGWIPNKKYTLQKKLLCNSNNKLDKLLNEMYINLKKETIIFCSSYEMSVEQNKLKSLYKIIPLEFFGSVFNRTKFFFIIKRIMSQTRGECIYMKCLYEGYTYDCISWLSLESNTVVSVKNQLCQANILVLQTVVKPFFTYFYYYVRDSKSRKYVFVPRSEMDSFIDKTHNFYIKMGILEQNKSKNPVHPNGTLMFIPKKSIFLDHRPLVLQYSKDKQNLNSIKKKIKLLSQTFKNGFTENLYETWKEYLILNKPSRKIFAIKLDIVDAFGLVIQNLLISLIEKDTHFFTKEDKLFLIHYISNQYVCLRTPNQIYRWNMGLPQGCKLSPLLCELYISYKCHQDLRHFLKPNAIIHRTVDDILYLTTSFNDFCQFEVATCKTFIINGSKTQKVLHIGKDPCISYCGKIFNMITREICNDYSFEKGTEMRTRFKIWNRKCEMKRNNIFQFINNCMKFCYVNFHFSKFVLNTHFNSTDSVLKNIFDGMCFMAFKLDSVIDSISHAFLSSEHRTEVIQKCINFLVQNYTFKIKSIIEKYKGNNFQEVFTFHTIKFLILKACIVVFNRRNQVYKEVIKNLKLNVKGLYLRKYDKYFSVLPLKFRNIQMHRKLCNFNSKLSIICEK